MPALGNMSPAMQPRSIVDGGGAMHDIPYYPKEVVPLAAFAKVAFEWLLNTFSVTYAMSLLSHSCNAGTSTDDAPTLLAKPLLQCRHSRPILPKSSTPVLNRVRKSRNRRFYWHSPPRGVGPCLHVVMRS